MNLWLKVVNVELVGRSANVALAVPVGSGDSEQIGHEHVVAKVELPVVVEEGAIEVHLDDEGLRMEVVLFAETGRFMLSKHVV